MNEELKEDMLIVNTLGMHARPAAKLVQTALQFKSDVHLQLNGTKINAKSIMGLMMLAAARGSRVTVTCKGSDAQCAMDAVRALLASGFGEE